MDISIIIPVYNVEKYLENCLESVIHQNCSDFEVILVNDGSTDQSGIICDAYAEKYRFVKVVHKENGGLSDARNTGTKVSSGRYITWLDGDDILHPDFLKVLFELAKENDADMAIGSFSFAVEGNDIVFPENGNETINDYNGREALIRMLRGEMVSTSACGFLIRKELAEQFEFPIGMYHEDDLTTYQFYLNAERVVYTTKPLYCYLQRSDSIMHKSFSRADIDELDAADEIYKHVRKLGSEYEDAAFVKKAYNYCDVFLKYDDLKKQNPDVYHRIDSFLIKNHRKLWGNPYIHRNTKAKVLIKKLGMLPVAVALHQKMKIGKEE